ncbi:hypothetical protein SUGI_0289730 [Cryptomeria japonica]|uniref:peamaclein-like n=1 Tax=Cryptomeria japonica TaxID=3369 RepID=UPI002408C92B|nr:peamaclein-like [Cryptomeria japonica]GLJ16818.1 hypothetical protein SUGI_0289730 [Cryptomeria japonica]
MEMKRAICVCLLLALFLALSLQTSAATYAVDNGYRVAPPPKLTEKECGKKCEVRCKNNDGYHKMCLKMCNVCCKSCSCVPSGQSGNGDECPCYRDRKNHKGKSKCP